MAIVAPASAPVAGTPCGASELLGRFDALPLDQSSIPQAQLDLVGRSRTSLFPWRGQFSPEFVELMLLTYARATDAIADPFVGSGTALFEAARRSLPAFGADVSPAAAAMAGAIRFASLDAERRSTHFRQIERMAERLIPPSFAVGLFATQAHGEVVGDDAADQALRSLLSAASPDPLLLNTVANIVIRLTDRRSGWPASFWRALHEHRAVIQSLPHTPYPCRAFHCDARALPLEDGSVQFIITSPPYINVFNYHQNHRPAMELMGWDMLRVARSEFGANRKNRGNRFLTVVQYALDMQQALVEARRILALGGHFTMVIGRESCVRGVPFQNGRIVAALAEGTGAFRLVLRQERTFTTRFGETIAEDILHFVPTLSRWAADARSARAVAVAVLEDAARVADPEVRCGIERAIEQAPNVEPSPLLCAPWPPEAMLAW